MAVEKFSPSLYASLGIFLPLIAVNCAILGGSLFMQQRDFPNVWTATCAGAGWGLGWLLAIVAIAAIRERLEEYSNIPRPLRGVGITFIITGLMGIAFMSFLGIKLWWINEYTITDHPCLNRFAHCDSRSGNIPDNHLAPGGYASRSQEIPRKDRTGAYQYQQR